MHPFREAVEAGDLDDFRSMVAGLAEDLDRTDIALAAVKLLHEASGVNTDEQDIPEIATGKPSHKKDRNLKDRHPKDRDKKDRSKADGPGKGERFSGPTTKLYVGLGRADGVRPKDLVGAIANETHLIGREIGPISITESFSTVGVPSAAVDDVIDAMKRTTIKGKKAKVRWDRVG